MAWDQVGSPAVTELCAACAPESEADACLCRLRQLDQASGECFPQQQRLKSTVSFDCTEMHGLERLFGPGMACKVD
eukprot:s3300_g9.t1